MRTLIAAVLLAGAALVAACEADPIAETEIHRNDLAVDNSACGPETDRACP